MVKYGWSIQSLLVFLLQGLRFEWSNVDTLPYGYMIMICDRILFELGDYVNAFTNNGNRKMEWRDEEGKEIS